MRDVWNYKQLMENKNEIQLSLLYYLLHDRSQELVSKPVINIALIKLIIVLLVSGDTENIGEEDI